MLRHKVRDFGIWEQIYDSAISLRQAYRCIGAEVWGGPENEVVVSPSWDNMEKARAFIDSSELRVALEHAGLIGQVEIMFLESIEKPAF